MRGAGSWGGGLTLIVVTQVQGGWDLLLPDTTTPEFLVSETPSRIQNFAVYLSSLQQIA